MIRPLSESSRLRPSQSKVSDAAGYVRDTVTGAPQKAADMAGDAASYVKDSVTGGAHRVMDTATSARDSASAAASNVGGKISVRPWHQGDFFVSASEPSLLSLLTGRGLLRLRQGRGAPRLCRGHR